MQDSIYPMTINLYFIHDFAVKHVLQPLVRPEFIFCFTDFFRNKLVSEDEIKIKLKFIWTIFQLN